ncbi:MAG: hypothetical protein EA001_13670 [Oscillatoriales cyanobacterium]|nr:MAG: hypothetical protein EA001_13670 [Oscillatoriales cyanobacterium]
MKRLVQSAIGPLVGWTALGAALRCVNLGGKPPSSIEVASIGFGLGQSFDNLPLDRLTTVTALLAPLRVNSQLGIDQTVARLASQSTHPPFFFVLMHGWLQWLTPAGGLVDLAQARLLSVGFGVLAIPLGFWLASWLAPVLWPTTDRLIAQVQTERRWLAHGVAAVLALSPYGVAIAQEARHYTLAVLWAIGTWAATIAAARRLHQGQSPGGWLGLGWVLGNGLALATHYFSLLGIASQGAAIGLVAIAQGRTQGWAVLQGRSWRQMGWIALAQVAVVAAWLPAIAGTSDSELTAWIREDLAPTEWLLPPLRLMVWLVTMLLLLPVENQPIAVIVASAIGLVALVILAVRAIGPIWWAERRRSDEAGLIWRTLAIGAIGPLLLMLGLIYSGKGDLSVAPRYQFVHFPLVVLGMGLALGLGAAQRRSVTIRRWQASGRAIALLLLVASLVGSLCVAGNVGFQKSRQVDRLWDWVEARSTDPALLVTEIETFAEVRSTVAIAYEWQRRRDRPPVITRPARPQFPPQFLMLRQTSDRADPAAPLAIVLGQLPQPLDLWVIDFSPQLNLEAIGCPRIQEPRPKTGYRLRHYRCTQPDAS